MSALCPIAFRSLRAGSTGRQLSVATRQTLSQPTFQACFSTSFRRTAEHGDVAAELMKTPIFKALSERPAAVEALKTIRNIMASKGSFA